MDQLSKYEEYKKELQKLKNKSGSLEVLISNFANQNNAKCFSNGKVSTYTQHPTAVSVPWSLIRIGDFDGAYFGSTALDDLTEQEIFDISDVLIRIQERRNVRIEYLQAKIDAVEELLSD